MAEYTHEEQYKIEKTLNELREFVCVEIGAERADIRIYANGDLMSNFLIEKNGSGFSVDIKKNGARTEKEHLYIEDTPFPDTWRG